MIIDVRFEVKNIQELRELLHTGKEYSLLDYNILKFANLPKKDKNSKFFGGGKGA